MRRRGRSVGAVAATLAVSMLATACHISPVKPDETVTISGRAVDGHGKPLAGATLHLYKEADFGEFIVGSVLAIGTLGGVCLLPGAPPLCHKAKSATTRSDGSFTFTLKGSDTTGLIGDESTMDLVVAAKGATATSASMTLSFRVTSATVALPTARLWDTAPRVAEGNGHIDLSWAALP